MGFVVPIALFFCIAAVIVASNWRQARERQASLEVIERLIDKGQEVPPELLTALQARRIRPPLRDLRLGLILIAMAGGFLTMAWSQYHFSRLDVPYVNGSMVGAAAFPGLIGLVLVGFWFMNRKRPFDDDMDI